MIAASVASFWGNLALVGLVVWAIVYQYQRR